jgi:hypothetical protein
MPVSQLWGWIAGGVGIVWVLSRGSPGFHNWPGGSNMMSYITDATRYGRHAGIVVSHLPLCFIPHPRGNRK